MAEISSVKFNNTPQDHAGVECFVRATTISIIVMYVYGDFVFVPRRCHLIIVVSHLLTMVCGHFGESLCS